MRVMGLDVGEKRIGVALSDPLGLMASPLTVVERRDDEAAIAQLVGLLEQNEVEQVVVGLPRSLDGSLGPQAKRVQQFIDALSRHTRLPLATWDERLSTVAAERMLRETGASQSKRKKVRDTAAAALILQAYLDWQHTSQGSEPK